MQNPQNLIRIRKSTDPRIPAAVFQAIPETANDGHDDDDGPGWVEGDYEVADYFAEGGYEGDASLAEAEVEGVVEEGGGCVAEEGDEED